MSISLHSNISNNYFLSIVLLKKYSIKKNLIWTFNFLWSNMTKNNNLLTKRAILTLDLLMRHTSRSLVSNNNLFNRVVNNQLNIPITWNVFHFVFSPWIIYGFWFNSLKGDCSKGRPTYWLCPWVVSSQLLPNKVIIHLLMANMIIITIIFRMTTCHCWLQFNHVKLFLPIFKI